MEIDLSTDDSADGDMMRPLSTKDGQYKIDDSEVIKGLEIEQNDIYKELIGNDDLAEINEMGPLSKEGKLDKTDGPEEVKDVEAEQNEIHNELISMDDLADINRMEPLSTECMQDKTDDSKEVNGLKVEQNIETFEAHHEKAPDDRPVQHSFLTSEGLQLSRLEYGNDFGMVVDETSHSTSENSSKNSVNEDIVCAQEELKDTQESEYIAWTRNDEQKTSEERILPDEGTCQSAQYNNIDNSTRGDFEATATAASVTQVSNCFAIIFIAILLSPE